jgi:pantetheine-phosphate adenylyltransferase
MKALYPGTFDPVTRGHLDIIHRADRMFDEVVVAVSDHGRKNTLFSVEERCHLIEQVTEDLPHVTVRSFTNLAVACAQEEKAKAILRGLRVTSDFEYEFSMARFMAEQDPSIQPVYLMAGARLTHVSSSSVKEVARLGGDVSRYVLPVVESALREKMEGASHAA